MKKNKIICLAVITLIIGCYFVVKGGAAIAATNYIKKQNQSVEVVILKGDTLWALAEKYGNPKKDIRQRIYQIQEINDLKLTEHIQPGQKIIIPKY
ncbi:MAG: LysM peptidoglycan-binding domain-containing protein [Bacillota bacterium]